MGFSLQCIGGPKDDVIVSPIIVFPHEKSRSLDDASLGRRIPWTTRLLDVASLARRLSWTTRLWTTRLLDGASLGRRLSWTTRL